MTQNRLIELLKNALEWAENVSKGTYNDLIYALGITDTELLELKPVKEHIEVTCYGSTKTYTSREQALKDYHEAILCSEGSERDRYIKIFIQLGRGYTKCKDEF